MHKNHLRTFKSKFPRTRNVYFKNLLGCQAPVTDACKPSYLRGWIQEDWDWSPPRQISLWDPISKIATVKWTGGVAQVVECLLCKPKVLTCVSFPLLYSDFSLLMHSTLNSHSVSLLSLLLTWLCLLIKTFRLKFFYNFCPA
jgi:hypothetical protein